MSDIIQIFSNHADTLVVLAVWGGLGIKDYFMGGSTLRKQITAEYKERNDQLALKISTLETDSKNTNLEVAGLKATLVEKDKHIKTLTEILQNRNPEMIQLLKDMKALMSTIINSNKYQTSILESVKRRNQNIDTASKNHTGSITRVPVDEN